MYQFIMSNWHTLFLIYIIGCVVTFILMLVFFRWVGKMEDEEREMCPDIYPEEIGGWQQKAVTILLSFLMAIIWVGAPVIFMGVWLLDVAVHKFPNLMGGLFGDNEETEEDKESD